MVVVVCCVLVVAVCDECGDTLVGSMGASGLVAVVEESEKLRQRLFDPHIWPVGQHPPPSDAGHDWKPEVQVSNDVIVVWLAVDSGDCVTRETIVVACPLTLFVTVTVCVVV